MSEASSRRTTEPAGVGRLRTRQQRARTRRARSMMAVFLACTVLGVACIAWALMNIRSQAEPVASSAEYVDPAPSQPITATATAATSAVEASATKKQGAPAKTARKSRKIVFAKNPSKGDTLGILTIPKLGQTLPIIEGTRTSDLKKGIGHFSQSVQPGQSDNCVVSGHRDSFFSRLGQLEKGDRVVVKTAKGTYTYQVRRTRIVGKNDRTVIVPTEHGVLTMTTCYPFRYVGNAPKRYIVSADLVKGK